MQLTVPVGELSPGQVVSLEQGDRGKLPADCLDAAGEGKYPVPKELWFLCDILTELGVGHENLFLQPGLRPEILALRDWLVRCTCTDIWLKPISAQDTGKPNPRPDVSIHSAAEALMIFLESLREPVVPFAFYSRCLECSGSYLQCKQVASQLPIHHKHVFDYLTGNYFY